MHYLREKRARFSPSQIPRLFPGKSFNRDFLYLAAPEILCGNKHWPSSATKQARKHLGQQEKDQIQGQQNQEHKIDGA